MNVTGCRSAIRRDGVEQVWHVPRHLAMAAAGEQGDDACDPPGRLNFAQNSAPVIDGLHDPRQRVADVGGRDAVLLEELLLEGEDTEKAMDSRAHGLDPALPPGPGLRSDQVDDRDALRRQFFGQPQVEIRGIGQDGDVRPLGGDRSDQLAEFAQMRGMWATTSTRPTTAIDRESTMARTPAACMRGPAHPKNSASGWRARRASTTREAYRSPEASPAEMKMRT